MEPDGDSPPIWSPPSTLFVPVRRRSRLSSVLNPVTLTIAFFVLIFIIFFLLPPTLSRNNQTPKPDSSVKKRWDSINIFLVLFAVLCGVFARRKDETSSSDGAETVPNAYEFANRGKRSVSGAAWLDPDRKAYDETSNYMSTGGNRLRRSSSSYPDLRQESVWETDCEKFRYFDDFLVDFHRPSGNSHRHSRQCHEVEKDVVAETSVREIPVDTFELKNSTPPPTQTITQVPHPPPPPPAVKRRRSVHSVPKEYNVERGGREAEFNEKRSSLPPPSKTPSPPPPPPPSSPPPELKFHPLAERREKTQRKKSGTTKEIATAIVSLYQGTQKKTKKKVKSRDIFEIVALNSSPSSVPAPSSIPSVPPPPPPPPPPPSTKVLQNFFKKSSKSKRVHSVSTANPPPPPPPPPSSIFNNIFKTGSKSKRFQLTSASSQPPPPPPPPPSSILNSLFKNGTKSRRLKYIESQPPPPLPPTAPKHSPASTGKPPKPTKPSTSHHESMVIATASPLIPMPPPPPPFRMPEMKFIVKGDFVRIGSGNSSESSSPGREDFEVKSYGGDSIGPSFTCPSPDVDAKADTFISKRRDEWRLEKINSWKEQRNTGS